MTRSPLTHLRLTTGNSHAFCGYKSDRWARIDVFPNNVTCLDCLSRAQAFYVKALGAVGERRAELDKARR
jgi:hypothetical protein